MLCGPGYKIGPRRTTISGFTIATSSSVGIYDVYVKQGALHKYILGYKFSHSVPSSVPSSVQSRATLESGAMIEQTNLQKNHSNIKK